MRVPPHGQFLRTLPTLLIHPGEFLPLEGISMEGGHTAEALSLFLNLSGLDKMIPEGPVLGPLSFQFLPGGVSITRTCELEGLGSL